MKTLIVLCTLCALAVGCTSKPKEADAKKQEADSALSIQVKPEDKESKEGKPEEGKLEEGKLGPLLYTSRQLSDIQSQIWKKLETLKGTPIANNVWASAVMVNSIEVRLRVNTAKKQEEFREKVLDSPALIFSGPDTPKVNNTVGVNDTLGVYLYPEYPVYSTKKAEVKLVLYNRSGVTVEYGTPYFVTYQDERGIWRDLASEMFFNSIGLGTKHNEEAEFHPALFPDINHNRPGRYRYFHEIQVGSKRLLMMAEFRLSSHEKEWKDIDKTHVPEEAIKHIVVNSPLDPAAQDMVFDMVEQMPQFPGGVDEMNHFISKNQPADITTQGRVVLQFIVEKDGKLSDIHLLRSLDETMDKEAIRIMEKMPKWIPGKQNGHPVRVQYRVLITFRMDPALEKLRR